MLPWLLMLAAAPAAAPMTPVEAERAFAADAQALGQWTAFRKWAADDATMFAPKPVKTHVFLKDRRDPPKAIEWWPTKSFISCDGSLAVNTGGWKRPDGTVGYFTTVWQRQKDGHWKWIVDGGDTLKEERARPAEPAIVRATCGNAPMWEKDDSPGLTETGASTDSTLIWRWIVWPDGAREMEVSAWEGTGWERVLTDHIDAPSP